MKPELIIFTGAMWSGKTTSMLASLDRFKYQGRQIFAFKPKKDDRYSECEIVSHTGWRHPAILLSEGKDILPALYKEFPDGFAASNVVVAVDEMFMIPGIAEQLIWLFKNDITVIVSSLDLSSNCQPFEEVQKLMPFATRIEKIAAVCAMCDGDAHYTWRKPVADESEILVGGGDLYSPRCKRHHPLMNIGD